ncbi:alpha/beta hydrolase [Rossellomorea marisflavi]|uniref:alpha/beta fold hydrolase n=1 Tax=Rossellomorea marisflavi TaxID=189381 RepID=UPI001EE31624|nr:alpha/beta hydrolase [Rossellomorea marisflavi]UKS66331.1 alpha/beta hydrolase [Rossellomorea marisflavi]WJV17937.1 alpha/beta hydrolase [Rossellomorea marisflavi]
MSLSLCEYGETSAPLLVFLHGGGVSGWMWNEQIEAFPDYHCVVPDLPGHGGSRHLDFTMKGTAGLLLTMIEEKSSGKPVHLIGFSLGAQLIVQMLSMNPHCAETAIINSALTRPMPSLIPVIRPLVRLTHPLTRLRWFAKLQARRLHLPDVLVENYWEESRELKASTLEQILVENMSFKIPPSFQETTARVLVTAGGKERTIMKKSAEDIQTKAKGSLYMFPGVGHGAPLANPDSFNHLVRKWVEDHTKRSHFL